MAKTFETIISVLDKASGPVLALEDKLKGLGKVGAHTQKALIMRPHEMLWNHLNSYASRARSVMGDLGEKVSDVGSRLAEVLPMIGAFGAAGSVAGLVELTHSAAEAAEQLRNVAIIAGATVPQMQALEFAGSKIGIAANQISMGLGRLNERIGKAAGGADKQVASAFKAMGISLRDAQGHIKTAVEVLPQLTSAFEKTHNAAIRGRLAMALFGRAGFEMLPFLMLGPEKLKELQAKFGAIGFKLGTRPQESLEKFQNSWIDLTTAVEGFRNAIAVSLGPAMAPLLEQFAKFLADNRRWIATDIGAAIKQVGHDLSKIHVKVVVDKLKHIMHVVGEVVHKLGGLKAVLITTGAVMATSFLAPIIRVNAQLLLMAARMGASMISSIGGFALSLLRLVPAIGSVSDAWIALRLAMVTNPLGAVLVGVTLLGAGAWVLYRNWDAVSKLLGKAWHWIGHKFHEVFAPIQAEIDRMTAGLHNLAATFGLASGHETAADVARERQRDIATSRAPAAPYAARFGNFHPNAGRAPVSGETTGRIESHIFVHGDTSGLRVSSKSSGIVKHPKISLDFGYNTLLHPRF